MLSRRQGRRQSMPMLAIPELGWVAAALASAPLIGKVSGLALSGMPDGRPLSLAEANCSACGATVGPSFAIPWIAGALPCRHCHEQSRWKFAVLEGTVTLLAVASVVTLEGPLVFIGVLLGAWLVLLAAFDVRYLWLPLQLTIPLVVFGLLMSGLTNLDAFQTSLIGAAAGYASFGIAAWVFRAWTGRVGLGGGDAWLAAAGGAWIGWESLPWMVLLATIGALAWIGALVAFKGRVAAGQRIPFGAWLAAGLWLVWIYKAAA